MLKWLALIILIIALIKPVCYVINNTLSAEVLKKISKSKDVILKLLIGVSAVFTCGILIWIIFYIVFNGISGIDIEFLTTAPFKDEGGVLPMIISTIWIVFIALIISTPIGIGAAIYLNEYAKPGKVVTVIRFAIESLAGIPSIIYGLFGLIFFVTMLKFSYSILAGALTVSIMVLPVIIRTTEESLKTVPNSYREGSLALGASKIRTVIKVVLPSAIPGILSGVILSVGRIVGETAAIYMTAGMVPKVPETIMNSGRTLSVHLYLLAKEGISFEKAYATATVLIVIVAIINFCANSVAKFLNRNTVMK